MGQKQSQIYCDCMPTHTCLDPSICNLHKTYIAIYKVHIELTGKLKKGELDKQFGRWGTTGWVSAHVTKINKNWIFVCYACSHCIADKRKASFIEYSGLGFIGKQSATPARDLIYIPVDI
jgi:hypothetical protein